MKSLHLSALFDLMAVSLLLTAGSGTAGKAGSRAATEPDLGTSKSGVARNLSPQVTIDDVTAAVNGNNDFALKSFKLLAPDGAGNTVFSPYSVTQAMAIAAAGANGGTLDGIGRALSFTLPQARLNPALNKLNLDLGTETAGSYSAQGAQAPNITIASAIWTQSCLTLLPSYLDTLAQNFGVGVNQVDFAGSPLAARMDINACVADQTGGLITNLVPADAIKKTTRMMLTDAVWFKGGWATPFDVRNTQNAPFHSIDGTNAVVPFMHQRAALPLYQGNGLTAVDLPYVGNNLALLVVMPDADSMPAYQSGLMLAGYRELVGKLATTNAVALSLPKFSFTSRPDIGTALRTLGMGSAFDPEKADFSGMDGRRDLSIEAIFQQARISVDEQGTQAAATAVTVGTSAVGAAPPAVTIVIDRPFLFFIRDSQNGAILFMGKVASIQQ